MLVEQTDFKNVAKEAKQRLKQGFWQDYNQELEVKKEQARTRGVNESRVERYCARKVADVVKGKRDNDEFYLKVKELLLREGEVSNAIGRLIDVEHFTTLNYEEKQRYTLNLSAMYLNAVERFNNEREIEC